MVHYIYWYISPTVKDNNKRAYWRFETNINSLPKPLNYTSFPYSLSYRDICKWSVFKAMEKIIKTLVYHFLSPAFKGGHLQLQVSTEWETSLDTVGYSCWATRTVHLLMLSWLGIRTDHLTPIQTGLIFLEETRCF